MSKPANKTVNGFYMETQFRQYYHKFARVHKATIRLEHKPALSMEVDWAGTKLGFFDTEMGKLAEASLFVAVLPCSQLIYAQPFRDEKMPSWIAGHVHAFEYFAGVPKTLVPDNLEDRSQAIRILRTGTQSHLSGNGRSLRNRDFTGTGKKTKG